MPDFRQPVGSSGLLVAAGLLGLVLGLHPVSVSAQWTNYYSCPTACAPAASNTCVYDCRDCLFYGYCSTFTPTFSNGTVPAPGNTYLSYDCSCSYSWSWWSWTLIAFGVALAVGLVVYAILACMRRQRMQKDAAYQQQQMAATGGVPGPYPGSEMHATGYPVPGYPGGSGYGYPPPPGYPGAPPPVYQATPVTAARPPRP